MTNCISVLTLFSIQCITFVQCEIMTLTMPEFPNIQAFQFNLDDAGTNVLLEKANEYSLRHNIYPVREIVERAEKMAYDTDQEKRRLHGWNPLAEDTSYLIYHQNARLIRAKVGRGTYGLSHIIHMYDGEENSGLTIGRFVQIAANLNLVLGLNHCYKRAAAYPFESLNLEFHNASGRYHTGMLKTNRCPYSNGPITIGNDVWIGMNVIITSGVTIGDGAILGLGAVVRENVPPYAIVVGNPAKVIKYRHSEEQIRKLLDIRWWEWSLEKLGANVELLIDPDVDRFIDAHWQDTVEVIT